MEILKQIYEVAMPIIVTGIIGILIKIIAPVGDVAIKYFKEKIESSGVTKQLAQHQDELLTAKNIWNVIEEKYRLSEQVGDLLVSKADMFEEMLLKKIPYLSKEDIRSLNKAIAGEFNKGKQAIITDDTLKQSNIELQNTNAQLVSQNNDITTQNQVLSQQVQDLQNKLNAINSALGSVNISSQSVDNSTQGNITVNIDGQVLSQTVNQATV